MNAMKDTKNRRRETSPGDIVFREGQDYDGCYLFDDGSVGVVVDYSGDKELDEYNDKDMFDERGRKPLGSIYIDRYDMNGEFYQGGCWLYYSGETLNDFCERNCEPYPVKSVPYDLYDALEKGNYKVASGMLASLDTKPHTKRSKFRLKPLIGLRDRKNVDELEVGKDYVEIWHHPERDYTNYIRVVGKSDTKRFGKRTYATGLHNKDNEIWVNAPYRSDYEYDDNVHPIISKEFDDFRDSHKIKEGMILSGCTHYGCSTPFFYKVLRRSGNTVTIQRLAIEKVVADNGDNYIARPTDKLIDKPERRKVYTYGLAEQVKSDWGILDIWNGRVIHGTTYD